MRQIRIGLVGGGWMGHAHASAFQNALLAFGPEPAVPVFEAVCTLSSDPSQDVKDTFGFRRSTARWQDLVIDPDIDLVDIATPNSSHAGIALAAIANGKHVYCETPLARSVADSRSMAEAAEQANVVNLASYNYLRNPIQSLAKKLATPDRLGEIMSFRATFDQDVVLDPSFPFTWRMDRSVAGTGALGDMGSHAISLALMLVGPIHQVSGMVKTFVTERPTADGAATRRVENEDIAQFICEFKNGALGHFSASRLGTGRKLGLTYEIQGRNGAICFNQERMNELDFFRQDEPQEIRGYKTIYTGPEQPGYAAFHPIPGVALGFNDQKTLEVRELVKAIAESGPVLTDFRFGYEVDRVIEAVMQSVRSRGWVPLSEIE